MNIKIENPHHPAREKPKRKGKTPPKLLAVVSQSGCTGCTVCIAGCPVDCIEIVPGPYGTEMDQMVEIDLSRCIGCQNCTQDCPWETISMYPAEEAFDVWSQETLISKLYVDIDTVQESEDKCQL